MGREMNIIHGNEAVHIAQGEELSPKLSVIIPFRYDSSMPYLANRLKDLCNSLPTNENIEILVVDSGSNHNESLVIQDICRSSFVRYIYHQSIGRAFSIGEARDFGVSNANGDAVTFLDVDLRFPQSFWTRLLSFMESYGVPRNKKSFFTIPCLYLTKEGTEEFITRQDDSRYNEALLKWLYGDKEYTQNLSPCSSVMIVNRLHYMSIGGHRSGFSGHGYEDFELIHRLLVEEGRVPRAPDYYWDAKQWDNPTYRGFRSQFSILGRPALLANLFVVHLWHPRPNTAHFYSSDRMRANRELWLTTLKDFDRNKLHPQPLIDHTAPTQPSMIFGVPDTNPMNCMRDAKPFLGPLVYMNEFDISDRNRNVDIEDLKALIQVHSIHRVIFTNPYANQARIQIYNWCRETGFPYLCVERGALPDSWFFDETGFNADSSIYRKEEWDRELTQAQIDATRVYIHQCLNSKESLEKQGSRIGGNALAQELGVGGKRVLFVPLQRPSDTVIKYFAGEAKDFGEFVSFIDKVAYRLKRLGWIVVCKKHPLETSSPSLEHAVYAHEDTHFLDLMEMADAVALINSGVGVYALMMGKPCFVFGRAFYSFNGLNMQARVADIDDFIEKLVVGQKVDLSLAYKFIHHLITKVYSFGKARVEIRVEPDGSMRSITTGIDYYDLKIPGHRQWTFNYPPHHKLDLTAPLFEKFYLDIQQSNKKRKTHEVTKIHTSATKSGKTRARIALLFSNPIAFMSALRGWIGRKLS